MERRDPCGTFFAADSVQHKDGTVQGTLVYQELAPDSPGFSGKIQAVDIVDVIL